MNSVTIVGNLTKDPDARTTSTNITKVKFTVAVPRRFKDKDGEKQTDFIQVVAFDKTADVCVKFLAKGNKVAIHGEWRTDKYQNTKGETVYTNDLVADNVEFLTPKGDDLPFPEVGKKGTDKQPDPLPIVEDDLPF